MRPISLAGVYSPVQFKQSEQPKKTVQSKIKDFSKENTGLITGLCCAAAAGAAFILIRNRHIANKLRYSYENFVKIAKKSGLKEPKDFLKSCTENNIIGTGENSTVYKFSQEPLKNWVIKVDKKLENPEKYFEQPLKKLETDFDEMNMGEAIAGIGDHVKILKKAEGTPHSFKDWAVRRAEKRKIEPEEAETFLSDIKQIAEFPQESYNELAKQIHRLEDAGYKANSLNPNNCLIDYKNKKINIINTYKYEPFGDINTVYDMWCPLVDFTNYGKFYFALNDANKAELVSTTKAIRHKCTVAAGRARVNGSEDTFKDFLVLTDKLENNGGKYAYQYKVMDLILKGQVRHD